MKLGNLLLYRLKSNDRVKKDDWAIWRENDAVGGRQPRKISERYIGRPAGTLTTMTLFRIVYPTPHKARRRKRFVKPTRPMPDYRKIDIDL